MSRSPIGLDVRLVDVTVGDRARKDYGDLASLMESIREHGLLQPVGLLSGNRLLFGGRRLEACRRLGWESVPAIYPATRADALSLLRAERDENICRKDMTPVELVDMTAAIQQMARADNEAKIAEAGRSHGRGMNSFPSAEEKLSKGDRSGWTSQVVADAVGMSRASYERTKQVVDTARDVAQDPEIRATAQAALDDLNAGRTSIHGAATRVRKARKAREARETRETGKGEGGPRSSRRTAERIAELAAQGWTSRQIADQIGRTAQYVRLLARRHGFDIPADKTMGKVRAIDSNRILDQIVRGLDGTRMAIDLIDYTDLDRGETPHWANSLDESIQALTTLRKHIKELTQ